MCILMLLFFCCFFQIKTRPHSTADGPTDVRRVPTQSDDARHNAQGTNHGKLAGVIHRSRRGHTQVMQGSYTGHAGVIHRSYTGHAGVIHRSCRGHT